MTDYKYLNIELLNDTDKPVIAQYNTEHTIPILDDPENYKLSIIRFNIPSSSIPIFIFEDNKYYLTLTYNNVDFQNVVIYSNNSPSYGEKTVYHYQDFIDMINNAFENSYNSLKIAFPLAPGTIAPYMTYDANNQLCTIHVETTFENNIKIFFNQFLYLFFDNFNVKFNGFNLPSKKDFEILIKNYKNNISGGFYLLRQEYSSLYYWNDLRTIIFLTNIQINNELSPSTLNNVDGVMTYTPILTDFQPVNNNNGEFRSYLQYQPNIYRYTDILAQEPLRKVSLRIFWEDKKKILRPLYIPPDEIISVKILFQKKYIL